MKKNIIALLLFAVTIIVGICSVALLKSEKAKYVLNYTENENLYTIKLYETKVIVNTKENEIDKIYKIAFNEENIDKVYDVFYELFADDTKTMDIKSNVLTLEQKKILDAVINNDDSLLEKEKQDEEQMNPVEDEVKLLFTLKSNRMNCNTIEVKVYDNKTYEVYNNYSETAKPITGTYSYDVDRIIENASKYVKMQTESFDLVDTNGKNIALYENNKELREFLTEIKINLDTCMVTE